MNVGSMTAYNGPKGDTIKGGGSYVREHSFGDEAFNFQSYRGRAYGYGRPANNSIAIERLGGVKGSDYVDGVLVIWVSKSCVVGWYEDARVYRKRQYPPRGANRAVGRHQCGYYVTAKFSECKILDSDARPAWPVPRAKNVKGGMGRYVWYAEGEARKPFLKRLLRFIDSGGKAGPWKAGARKGSGKGWQLDPRKRKKIEDAAIDETIRFYAGLGYAIKDRQDEHVGWDLEAEQGGRVLKLEVKGV
jgi:hypothetical protein